MIDWLGDPLPEIKIHQQLWSPWGGFLSGRMQNKACETCTVHVPDLPSLSVTLLSDNPEQGHFPSGAG